MNPQLLAETAGRLIADDKGILAMDESSSTCNRRFAGLGIPQTAEMRREDRELLMTAPVPATVDEVANATLMELLRTVPAAIPGIAFLSGGQSGELATAHLNAMNRRLKSRPPWALAFSFARAIQRPVLDLWRGEAGNVKAAQHALAHRARCNRTARRGEYVIAMEGGRG